MVLLNVLLNFKFNTPNRPFPKIQILDINGYIAITVFEPIHRVPSILGCDSQCPSARSI